VDRSRARLKQVQETMKKRILFVDDEPKLLELYEAMLSPMQGDWDLVFLTDPSAALERMDREPFDVLVTDMRMPGMTGAQLLNEVMRRHPRTSRIVLSGYAEQEVVAECLGATHQYLSKPCTLGVLQSTIARIVALDQLLMNANLRGLVTRLRSLPSLPSLYFKIIRAVDSPDASMEQIGEIISKDLGMTTKILQLVNSAFFGMPRKVSNAKEAVQFLGVGMVRSLALSLHLFSCFDPARQRSFSVDRLWKHSLACGAYARLIAEAEHADSSFVDDAFVSGMLHDVGKLMLAANLPDQYGEAVALAEQRNLPASEAEQAVFGATHSEVGAYLLGLWGLPAAVVEAVALHHTPGRTAVKGFSPLTAVHVANVLQSERERADAPANHAPPVPLELDQEYLAAAGLADRVEAWRTTVSGTSGLGLGR
jgi:HD-like signal output (HDOD) protein/CheY-like chemotaxis protein